jgi:hypothetical protein
MQPHQAATDSDNTNVVQPKPRQHAWRWLFGLALALALGLLVGWLCYPHFHKPTHVGTVNTNTATNTPTKPASSEPTTENVTSNLSLDYVPTVGAGESSQPLTISIDVPLVLRT